MGTAIISSFGVTAIWILVHLISMHLKPAQRRMVAMTRVFVLSIPVLLATLAVLNHSKKIVLVLNGNESVLMSYIFALLIHLLLFFLFVECFYHVERSVTLRLLIEIQTFQSGKPTIDAIMKDYSVDDMIRRRLEDMSRNGFVRKSNGAWVLSSKGRAMAGIMNFSSWIFQSKPQNERL